MVDSSERSAVRRAGRSARQAVSGAERLQAEARLVGHAQSLTAMSAPSVGVFVAHDGEPDLSPLVESCWSAGQLVALPMLSDDPDDHSMRFVPWEPHGELQPGRYGIPVPVSALTGAVASLAPHTLLVSLTGFDADGNRMGRGGGFFDRYLATYAGAVIGIGFEAQRFDRVPTADHDVALPAMVTEHGVRFFP